MTKVNMPKPAALGLLAAFALTLILGCESLGPMPDLSEVQEFTPKYQWGMRVSIIEKGDPYSPDYWMHVDFFDGIETEPIPVLRTARLHLPDDTLEIDGTNWLGSDLTGVEIERIPRNMTLEPLFGPSYTLNLGGNYAYPFEVYCPLVLSLEDPELPIVYSPRNAEGDNVRVDLYLWDRDTEQWRFLKTRSNVERNYSRIYFQRSTYAQGAEPGDSLKAVVRASTNLAVSDNFPAICSARLHRVTQEHVIVLR